MFGYDGVKDMFDGGGAGQSGTSFSGGGPISSMANMVATPRGSRTSGGEIRPQGRPDMGAMMQRQQQKPSFLRDMFDGGGMGASGDRFEGAGAFSGLLNMLGVQPLGARDRGTLSSYMEALQAASQPQMQPRSTYTPPMPPATSVRPQMRPMGPPALSPVNEYPLSDFGDMLMRLERDGIQPAYRPQPMYGPR